MKRKIEKDLLEWKKKSNGRTVLLLEGARRIGKSYSVKMFAESMYRSYILVDFNEVGEEIRKLFEMNLRDLDSFFINKILSVVVGGNPLPLGGGRSLVNL